MRVQTSIYKYKGFPEHYIRDFRNKELILQWLGTTRVVQAKDCTADLESLLVVASLQQGWEYRTGVIAQLGLNHCDVPHSANEGAGKHNKVKVKIKNNSGTKRIDRLDKRHSGLRNTITSPSKTLFFASLVSQS